MNLSDVIAVFALLTSGFALYKQLKKDKVSQNTIFFNQIFFEFLTQDCVEARNDIRFDNCGRLENTEKFEVLIAELGNKISFYEYVDKSFYDQLRKLLTELDDLVVDDKEYRGKKQTDHSNEIDKKILELFKLIMDKYFVK
ncbi:hypothetical protein [Streptococcus salivarius]|uniref:hypothetical protein n=1 Tax=Streptococcus salivarius TaxID=1304 RepID=UPI000E5008B0|nr:hypothetical protein [Streptococcus salivarius]MCY7036670.1 hypothetical protein [Streptococcus salivarius]MEB3646366.1 hypothetical protein [Streptococcus salivarius]RGS17891.1 hypothetical protein DWY09_08145 [Streptococcus salivarius]